MKKLSKLMLEGYAMVGKQCVGDYCKGNPRNPRAVCGAGAAFFAYSRVAAPPETNYDVDRLLGDFCKAVGITVSELNDGGMSIPDIAGIAAAEGL